ncbi:MAG: phosphoribosyltransferase [Desulfovibrionaceae bacterium]|nr:phosphoribosyltransferase [Desulfovibrionaceae bacterium]
MRVQDMHIQDRSHLINHGKGVVVIHNASNVCKLKDWDDAKGGDIEAANKLLDKFWKTKSFNELQELLDLSEKIVFLSVPSSSGKNMITEVLGERLANYFSAKFYSGRNFYVPEKLGLSKFMDDYDRVFTPKKYKKIADTSLLKDSQIVVIEDLMLTGSSIFSFIRQLRSDELYVRTFAALLGNPQLEATPNDIAELAKRLSELNIQLDADLIGRIFSHSEISIIRSSLDWKKKSHVINDLNIQIKERSFKLEN